ncbi:MarR family winged helix-turn-helix transcriptional regulator [Streptomyces sp. CMB-StM0423]|uniref:MarR family winged helix-turn-helix transcriptional regulator n=1 Tax=Streptomyces sp. CMB-StM0423 TaxID=2059884 RepID=UPI000C709E62|nr:MarR family transcriptional regulator [Streptomyces sp. CMB-StM0423]AUH44301.1 MarR family transcriptional regulator [Streptomyces sp. CMB-StM0423]
MATGSAEGAVVSQWREIRAVHARAVGELDRELHRYGIGASDFEVLDVLLGMANSGDKASLRVQELADRVHLSQSALSRLVGRLEKHGLVTRGMCPEDRRGVQVCVTDAGRRLHAEALPVQRAVLARTVGVR